MTRAAHRPSAADASTAWLREADTAGPRAGAGAKAGAGAGRPVWKRALPWMRRQLQGPVAFDVAVCLVYLCLAAWLLRGLWPSPATRALAHNVNDQALIEWFLAHGVLFWTGDFSLVTDRLNVPDGVNLMSNASHIAHGVLMAPVTVLFGAPVSFAVLAVVNLAATAAGWYLLMARGLRLHRTAAMVAAAFAGFAPGMISQTNSHLHITAQWLVPPMVWCVIRLTRVRTERQLVATALGLALLVCVQVFLGEEVLYLTVVTLALFAVAYAAMRRRWARQAALRVASGIALSAGVSTLLLAYPLWVQFSGPRHTSNAPFGAEFFYADLASFTAFSPFSLAGDESAVRLASSETELNTYFGAPLLLVVLGCVIWRRRCPVTVAAAASGVVMTLLSLGPFITLGGERTGWPSLYNLIAGLPVIEGALPTRYALALIPLVAIVLAYALDAATRLDPSNRRRRIGRILVPAAVILALFPVLPRTLPTTDRLPVPSFISSGAWRQCAPQGGVIVPVPLPTPRQPDAMRWAAAANAAFAIPEGFFIGPDGPGGKSSIGTYPRPLSRLLAEVARTGVVPEIDDAAREQARRDLEYWRADCVALARVPNVEALRVTLQALLGPGQLIADTWTWTIDRP